MRELLEHADRVLIGGHRGSACRYPENSIEAMEHGLLSGADYLEIDIQLPHLMASSKVQRPGQFSLDMQEVNFRLLEAMVPVLERTGMKKRVFVFGPDYQVLKRMKQLDPEVEIGLIVPFIP